MVAAGVVAIAVVAATAADIVKLTYNRGSGRHLNSTRRCPCLPFRALFRSETCYLHFRMVLLISG
jgi:hypothetical protein